MSSPAVSPAVTWHFFSECRHNIILDCYCTWPVFLSKQRYTGVSHSLKQEWRNGQTKQITSCSQPLILEKALLWFWFCCGGFCWFWFWLFCWVFLNNVFMQLITAIFGTWHESLLYVLWCLYLFLYPGLTCQFSVVLHCSQTRAPRWQGSNFTGSSNDRFSSWYSVLHCRMQEDTAPIITPYGISFCFRRTTQVQNLCLFRAKS